jgi:hypothetical protein
MQKKGVAQVIECLPTMNEALNSTPPKKREIGFNFIL